MQCKNNKTNAKHSGLCHIHYPCSRIASSRDYPASHQSDCTRGVSSATPRQKLGYEAKMHMLNLDELVSFTSPNVVFGTYCAKPKSKKREHFCVDHARRTVDGRRLSWLWVFPNGKPSPVHRRMVDIPTMVWSKQDLISAYRAAANPTLPMFTRHVDQYSELAITFCLPFP